MQNLQAIVLAAGKATRFKTGKSKLIETICGQEIILYSIKLLESLHIPISVVVGFQKEEIINVITANTHKPITFITQEKQLGTGHAVRCSQHEWHADNILVMNGDMPLVTQEIIQGLYEKHQNTGAALSFVTAHHPENGHGYGRVITSKDGVISIIEDHEFAGDVDEHCCINAGIYIIRRNFLENYIAKLDEHTSKQEFYLTDLVKIASENRLGVQTLTVPFDHIRGINTLKELWAVEQIQRAELINNFMLGGVRFPLAQNVHIDLDVSIGSGTEIGSGVLLRKGTRIGHNCVIGDFSIIENSHLADHVTVHPHTIISSSKIEDGTQVGPFAHVREHAVIGREAVIGNFVEIKKTVIGERTKAKHLSYLGDAMIGSQVNIGAGTITCNHDGVKKNTTTIEDHAYIGSNNALVAPVTIGKSAYTAAGSTITDNVPAQALGIARARQENKEGYAQKLRAKKEEKKEDDLFSAAFIAAVKTKNDSSFN